MHRRSSAFLALAVALAAVTLPLAQSVERVDSATLARIRDEGMNRSQVMDHIWWLSDVHGPRLTGGPQILRASDWVIRKFAEWGVANAHREPFAFGRGWSLVRFSAHMIEPQVQPLVGFPGAWSPSTRGTISADVVRVQIDSEADFERYKGKLAGTMVLTQPAREVRMLEGPIISRMGDEELAEATTAPPPRVRIVEDEDEGPAARQRAARLRVQTMRFLKAEGVVAAFDRGSDGDLASVGSNLTFLQQRPDGGTVFPATGASRTADPDTIVPVVTLAVEHYNRMVRLLERSIPVRVELNLQTRFHDETTPNGFNTIAEIPGTDPALKDEVVILGAHLDSVAAATGATDNATGTAAVMEAMRILTTLGVKPRRTIRAALWGAEEQGLLGSRAYVREHFGDRQTMALKPAHANVAAYFNTDNGTGRIRGVWLQGNEAVRPIFERWIEPLRDLGVIALGPRSVGSTDHVAFDEVGLPAFQFMVDRLEYNSRTHHSNMDTFDRVQRADMVQHATVLAVFAYNAASRDEKLPRKPVPKPQRRQERG